MITNDHWKQTGSTLTDAEINHLQAKFNSLTNGNGMTADTLREIYKTAKIEATDAEIQEQVRVEIKWGMGLDLLIESIVYKDPCCRY